MLPYGPVVQLVRTLACHARGQGFESPSGRHNAFVAQSVVHLLGKQEVTSSSLVESSTKYVIETCEAYDGRGFCGVPYYNITRKGEKIDVNYKRNDG